MNRTSVEVQCQTCSTLFLARPADVKRKLAKFCSLSCFHQSVRGKKKPKEHNTTCATCGISVYKTQSEIDASKSGLLFCSRSCKDKGQRVESGLPGIHPPHYKTGARGYRKRVIKDRPLVCEACGYKKVPAILQVHHKDRDRSNGAADNLIILCPNCHEEEHYATKSGRYSQLS